MNAVLKSAMHPDEWKARLELAACYRDLGNSETASRLLMPQLDNPQLTLREAYDLAMMLDGLKAHAGAVRAMDRVMAQLPENAPPDLLLSAARVYAGAQQAKKMIVPLSRYLRQRPADWQAWLDLATLYIIENNGAQAQAAVRRALELGGQQARQLIEGNPQLRPLASALRPPNAAAPDAGLGWR